MQLYIFVFFIGKKSENKKKIVFPFIFLTKIEFLMENLFLFDAVEIDSILKIVQI